MAHVNPPDDRLREILTGASTIAVVGASSNPERASYGIMRRLQQSGYRVVPVNPNEREILGETAYPALADIPVPVDIVSIFRRSEDTPPIADEAVAIGASVLWMQTGISNEEAARHARAGGLTVVMDLCIATEHAYLGIPARRVTAN